MEIEGSTWLVKDTLSARCLRARIRSAILNGGNTGVRHTTVAKATGGGIGHELNSGSCKLLQQNWNGEGLVERPNPEWETRGEDPNCRRDTRLLPGSGKALETAGPARLFAELAGRQGGRTELMKMAGNGWMHLYI